MKTNLCSLPNRLTIGIGLMIIFGLTAPSGYAQTFMGRPGLTNESPTSLRTIITPVSNSSIIRIRFENQGRGSVHMQIRDTKGKILLDESQPKRVYAGQFDMASLPAGLYTIELRTLDSRHTELIQIEAPTTGRIITLSKPSTVTELATKQ